MTDINEQVKFSNVENGRVERSLVCAGDDIRCPQRTAIEIYGEYVTAWGSNDLLTVVIGDMRDYRTLGLREFDCALFIDSIEHIGRSDALKLISQLQEDRVRIVAFVPEGVHPRTESAWGDDNSRQAHLSTWQHEDFAALGFETEQWLGFHKDIENGDAFVASWTP